MTDHTDRLPERVALLEHRVETEVATRMMLQEAIVPIRESQLRQENTIAALAGSVGELTKDTKGLTEMHNQFLKERAERDKLEHEERMKQLQNQTWLSVLTARWGPIAVALMGMLGLIKIIIDFAKPMLGMH